MAKIFQTVVRRLIQAGGGNGFIASVIRCGIRFSNQITLIGARNLVGIALLMTIGALFTVRPAMAFALLGAAGAINVAKAVGIRITNQIALNIAQSPAVRLLLAPLSAYGTAVNAGIRTALLGVVGVLGLTQLRPALALAAVIRQHLTPLTPACSIVRVVYNLTKRSGADSVAETAVGGRTDWASDANAAGIHNGSNATFVGNALGARGGQLELSYPNSLGKSDLTITSATLYFYGSVSGTVLNNADVQLKYDIGAGFVTLETITGNADFSVTPKVHDISAALNTWAEFDALRAAVSASAALGETWSATLDAVEIEILANRTDTL